MKKLLLLVFTIVMCMPMCACVSAQSYSANKRVAVFVKGDVNRTYKRVISAKAIWRISQTAGYTVLERSENFMDALMAEQDYQVSGDVRDDHIVAFGRRHGATHVVVLDVTMTPDNYCFMTGRLIEIRSGVVVKSCDSNRRVCGTADIVNQTNNLTYRLVANNVN